MSIADDWIDAAHTDRQFRKLELQQCQAGDQSPGDVISARADGTIVLDDGITTHSYERACEFLESLAAARADSIARMLASFAQIMELSAGPNGGAQAKEIARAALERAP